MHLFFIAVLNNMYIVIVTFIFLRVQHKIIRESDNHLHIYDSHAITNYKLLFNWLFEECS